MSFLDNVGKLASDYLGGANQQQTADAASEHVATMDEGQLQGHLTESLGHMDQASVAGLGQQLLQAFTNHPAYNGDANTATQDAGVSQAAVASGDPGAVGMLINLAKQNPGILQSAASAFLSKNPGAVAQLAPTLLSGILGRLGTH